MNRNPDICYIDRGLCTGARYSFCPNCKEAMIIQKVKITAARSPVQLSMAHILVKK